jgi:hypothetical protein
VPHRFQLCTIDGDRIGEIELPTGHWPAGSVIYRPAATPNLRVIRQLPPNGSGVPTLLVAASPSTCARVTRMRGTVASTRSTPRRQRT